jgi:hypothetical protein
MRRLLALLATALLLGTGATLAQTPDTTTATTITIDDVNRTPYWAGVSFGFPGISAHFGIQNALGQGADLRANLGYNYIGSGLALGADALFNIGITNVDAPINFYAGGGPFVVVGGGFGAGIQGLIGAEYRLVDAGFDTGGVFLELGPAISFGSTGGGFGFVGRAGFNYHF